MFCSFFGLIATVAHEPEHPPQRHSGEEGQQQEGDGHAFFTSKRAMYSA
jgi:hypothetical protein